MKREDKREDLARAQVAAGTARPWAVHRPLAGDGAALAGAAAGPEEVEVARAGGEPTAALAPGQDWLAEEMPVALVFNGIGHAVMMASPADLEDFALGFALTEGLIERPEEFYGADVVAAGVGLELRVELAARCLAALKDKRRMLAGRTGCGLCGAETLAQAIPPSPAVPGPQAGTAPLPPGALQRAQQELHTRQAVQALTGATHAAAWCSEDGDVLCVREDVGRHNALDKLIGALHRQRLDTRHGFVLLTSRASFEMVHKCARAGLGTLAAVSAPTGLAAERAVAAGIALAGWVRGQGFVAFNRPERFGSVGSCQAVEAPAAKPDMRYGLPGLFSPQDAGGAAAPVNPIVSTGQAPD